MRTEPSRWRWLYLPAAAILPFALEASFIVITREHFPAADWVGGADWIALFTCVFIGLYCVWRLPVPGHVKAGATVVYVPAVGLLWVMLALGIVKARYGITL